MAKNTIEDYLESTSRWEPHELIKPKIPTVRIKQNPYDAKIRNAQVFFQPKEVKPQGERKETEGRTIIEKLKKENAELKRELKNLRSPEKLAKISLGLLVLSGSSIIVGNLTQLNLLHPFFATGVFSMGLAFYIIARILGSKKA